MTKSEAKKEVERLVSAAQQAILADVPLPLALAALETRLVSLIDSLKLVT